MTLMLTGLAGEDVTVTLTRIYVGVNGSNDPGKEGVEAQSELDTRAVMSLIHLLVATINRSATAAATVASGKGT